MGDLGMTLMSNFEMMLRMSNVRMIMVLRTR